MFRFQRFVCHDVEHVFFMDITYMTRTKRATYRKTIKRKTIKTKKYHGRNRKRGGLLGFGKVVSGVEHGSAKLGNTAKTYLLRGSQTPDEYRLDQIAQMKNKIEATTNDSVTFDPRAYNDAQECIRRYVDPLLAAGKIQDAHINMQHFCSQEHPLEKKEHDEKMKKVRGDILGTAAAGVLIGTVA